MMFAVIKKIPQILENPTLVLKSKDKADGKQNTRLVMFGSVKGKHGAPVMCVLDLRPVEKGFVIDGVQKVNSAYVKDSGPIQFVRNRSYHLTTQRKRSFFPNRQSQYRICKRWAEILYADPGYSQKGKTTAQLEAENRKLRESLEITRELPQSTPPQKLLILSVK